MLCRPVDGAAPWLPLVGAGIGVDGDQHLGACCMGIVDAAPDLLIIKVEPREVACIGAIAKADVDAVGAMVDRGLERGQTARGAHQFRFICGRHQRASS